MEEKTVKNDLCVRDLMSPDVITVRPDDSVATAYELMLEHRFRHLVVSDADGDLVGLLTHRDLLRSSLIERSELSMGLQCTVMQRIRVDDTCQRDVAARRAVGSRAA